MGSAGREWLIHDIMSSVIIVASTVYYYIFKRKLNEVISISSNTEDQQQKQEPKITNIKYQERTSKKELLLADSKHRQYYFTFP